MENKEKSKVFKKDRTISFVIIVLALAGFLVAVSFDARPVITVIMALIAPVATFEIIRAVGGKSKVLFAVSCAVSIFTVLSYGFGIALPSASVLYGIYVLLLMSLMVFFHKQIQFTHASAAFMASLALPFAFSCFLRLMESAISLYAMGSIYFKDKSSSSHLIVDIPSL